MPRRFLAFNKLVDRTENFIEPGTPSTTSTKTQLKLLEHVIYCLGPLPRNGDTNQGSGQVVIDLDLWRTTATVLWFVRNKHVGDRLVGDWCMSWCIGSGDVG